MSTRVKPSVFDVNVSMFSCASDTRPRPTTLCAILEAIRNGNYRTVVEPLRALPQKEYDTQKKLLPAFSPAGTFRNSRSTSHLEAHSGFAVLDFDDVPHLPDAKVRLQQDPYTAACFFSPSGKGLKVFVRVEGVTTAEEHKAMFPFFAEYYRRMGLRLDMSGSDVSRLCFVSCDAGLYQSEEAKAFSVEEGRKFATPKKSVEAPTNAFPTNGSTNHSHKRKIALKVFGEAKNALRHAPKGTRHDTRRKHICLVGGYIQQDGLTESEVRAELLPIVRDSSDAPEFAEKEFEEFLEYGKQHPIHLEREAQKQREYAESKNGQHVNGTGHKKSPAPEEKSEAKEFSNPHENTAKPASEQEKNDILFTEDDIFWYEMQKGDAQRGGVSSTTHFDRKKVFDFLSKHGYAKTYIEELSSVLIHVQENLVCEKSAEHITDFMQRVILNLPETIAPEQKRDLVLNTFFRNSKTIFTESQYKLLPAKKLDLKRDTRVASYFFFGNCFVEVSADALTQKPYTELNGEIWEKHRNPFDLADNPHTNWLAEAQGDFAQFITNVCSPMHDDKQRQTDTQRREALWSAIGYLLHGFKESRTPKAIVFCEEKISDAAEGQTGKGLTMKAIQKIRSVVTESGKQFKTDAAFAFQGVKLDTQILLLDDVTAHFSFESLFSILTNGLKVERKNKDAVYLSVEDTPKIVITTNYTLRGESGSHKARKFEIEFADYYSSEFSPADDFGRAFFTEWDATEWNRFYWFMMMCTQFYLQQGLVRYEHKNLNRRKLIHQTAGEFVEFADELPRNQELLTKEKYTRFLEEHPDYNPEKDRKDGIKQNTFTSWLKTYAQFSELKFEKWRKTNKNDGKDDYFKFTQQGSSE